MAILENPYFVVIMGIFVILILILSQILMTRSMITHANIKFEELDYKLGEIVTKLIEDLPLNIDPDNQVTPIQAFIMDMVKERMNPAIQVKEITQERDGSGKFM